MPISEMKFIGIKSEGTHYRLLCFRFGGGEEEFVRAGFGSFDYIAGILLGANYALFIDRVDGSGRYAVEKAGWLNGDLAKGWEYVLRNFDTLENHSLLKLERIAGGDWVVREVETDLLERR